MAVDMFQEALYGIVHAGGCIFPGVVLDIGRLAGLLCIVYSKYKVCMFKTNLAISLVFPLFISHLTMVILKKRTFKHHCYPESLFSMLQVMYNFDESEAWKPCFVVSDVDLPTGYHFGFTAVTGDLCGKYVVQQITGAPPSFTPLFHFRCKCPDNHDIVSVRVYDVDSQMEDAKKQNSDQPTADVVSEKTTKDRLALTSGAQKCVCGERWL